MAVDAVKIQNTKWASSVPGVVSEAGNKRTEETQTKGQTKDLGLQAPWAHMATHSSCPAQNVMIPSLSGLTLPLVFQRGRHLNKDEKFTRGEKRVMSQVLVTVQYVLVFLVAQRVQE